MRLVDFADISKLLVCVLRKRGLEFARRYYYYYCRGSESSQQSLRTAHTPHTDFKFRTKPSRILRGGQASLMASSVHLFAFFFQVLRLVHAGSSLTTENASPAKVKPSFRVRPRHIAHGFYEPLPTIDGNNQFCCFFCSPDFLPFIWDYLIDFNHLTQHFRRKSKKTKSAVPSNFARAT